MNSATYAPAPPSKIMATPKDGHPLDASIKKLLGQLESNYAVTAINLSEATAGNLPGFNKIIIFDVKGDLVGTLKKVLADTWVNYKSLVVCTGTIPAKQGQLQAHQFKGFVEKYRFSPGDRGPAFLLLGKSLAAAMDKEPDLIGRIHHWEAK